MDKLLLLSCIKGLIFVLKSSFISTTKKASELNLCSRFKIYGLIVLTLQFALKVIFCAVKKVSFLQSKNFSAVKDLKGASIKGQEGSLIKGPKGSLIKGPKMLGCASSRYTIYVRIMPFFACL